MQSIGMLGVVRTQHDTTRQAMYVKRNIRSVRETTVAVEKQ